MKAAIQDFFTQTFYNLVEAEDPATTEARKERYQSMLNHYLDVVEKNVCGCFNNPEDIINEIKKMEDVIREYIATGKLPTNT
jgi:hypothetical protein